MKSFLLVVVAFLFGTAVAVEYGFNPIAGGSAGVALNMIPKGVNGQVAMAGVNLTALTSQLGGYSRKFEAKIWTRMFKELQAEKYMAPVPNVQDQYAVSSASITNVLQPYQSAWTPAGTVSVTARVNKVRPIKLDIAIDDIDEIERSYIGFMADETKSRKDWPFVKFIVEELVMPKLAEELDHASYNAVYVAPTAGTAGTPLTIADGIKKIIADEITATNLVPIATGALVATTMVDQVELFCAGIPAPYRNMKMKLKMSTSNAEAYAIDYRDNFGVNTDYKEDHTMKVWGKGNIEIVGLDSMEGSDRFIATPEGNMIKMYDKIYTPGSLDFQLDKRVVNMLGNFKRGWGFKRLDNLFVNEQA